MPFGGLDPSLELLGRNVLDAAFEVYRVLGPGFCESVYENAFALELKHRGLPYERQVAVNVCYKGEAVGRGFVDVLVDNQLVIELKATEEIARVHRAQLASYLKATQLDLGFVITFNVAHFKMGIRRVVRELTEKRDPADFDP
jgi:GxxExxY protein